MKVASAEKCEELVVENKYKCNKSDIYSWGDISKDYKECVCCLDPKTAESEANSSEQFNLYQI